MLANQLPDPPDLIIASRVAWHMRVTASCVKIMVSWNSRSG
jgi:hypothetical protein